MISKRADNSLQNNEVSHRTHRGILLKADYLFDLHFILSKNTKHNLNTLWWIYSNSTLTVTPGMFNQELGVCSEKENK